MSVATRETMNELQQKVRALLADLTKEIKNGPPVWLAPIIQQLEELETLAADAPVRSQALVAAGQRELQEHLDVYEKLSANLCGLSNHWGEEPNTAVTEELLQHATALHTVACGYVAVKRALTVPKCTHCGKPAVATRGTTPITVSFCAKCLGLWERHCATHCSKCEAKDVPLDEQGLCAKCARCADE